MMNPIGFLSMIAALSLAPVAWADKIAFDSGESSRS